ncbi:Bug family tripartite tricarboxylate transporter substrate binding protein [Hydrogenophaga sp. BPS33]|uniref:Bug family tripartite tricarboxylate transporter substrate binding protein n=1 Tax=Hydrogenophaga sp. BPS33 TaxID=2651974 RepID=UPI00131F5769|nr:tripartite tricarboxylate transporter substrate-binding protein [Hydrogenophaga sp. BPS33]QHE87525.1 tripartite tricarboxylate transporter substrate binding protein [Hydrogenophaga sp. BPS33]
MRALKFKMAIAGAAVAMAASLAHAEYPERPLRIYVATAAGGGADLVIRAIAEKAQQFLGQPIVIENRTGGAAGSVATQALLASPPDGYAAVYQTTTMAILPSLTKLPFDPEELVPVIRTGSSPYAIVVASNFPAKNFDEFVAYAKSRPGKLNCSTIGVGSAPHLALELLLKEANIDIVHVPYRGFALAYPDLRTGRIDCSIEPPLSLTNYVRSGDLRALGVTQKMPAAEVPDAFPIATKYPGVDVQGWGGIFVSKKVPKAVVDRLHADLAKAIRDPAVAKRLVELGVQSDAEPAEVFAATIEADRKRYADIVKARNIKLP